MKDTLKSSISMLLLILSICLSRDFDITTVPGVSVLFNLHLRIGES